MQFKTLLLTGLFCLSSVAIAQQAPVSPGTSSSTSQAAPTSTPAGKATIYVYRPGSAIGAANHPVVLVNDNYLVSLHNSEYSSREVTAGTVVFSYLPKTTVSVSVLQWGQDLQKKPTELLRTEVEAGKTYYFKWSYAARGGHFLEAEDEATGAKEMKKVHPAKE
jgi:hypothetical protein